MGRLRWLMLLALLWSGLASAESRLDVACLPGSQGMQLAQVQAAPSDAWRPSGERQPFHDVAIGEWCRMVAQDTYDDGMLIEFGSLGLVSSSVVEVYLPQADGSLQTASMQPHANGWASLQPPVLRVRESQEGQPLYLHFTGSRTPRGVTLVANSLPDGVHHARDSHAFNIAILTGMLMMGVMAAIFALQLGRGILIYLAIWVAAVVVMQGLESGLLFERLPFNLDVLLLLHSVALTTAVASSVTFSQKYLNLPGHFHLLSRAVWVCMGAMIVSSALYFFTRNEVSRSWLNGMVFLQFATIVGAASVLAIRGKPQSRFFMLGWSPVLIMSSVRVWHLLMSIPPAPWVDMLWKITLMFAVFVLLIATARAAGYAEREMHSARKQATRDPLTGVANRAFLFAHLADDVETSRSTGRPLSVLFMDIDHFKAINDQCGHAFGDDCLRHFARILQTRLRADDVLARVGGEEFVVVMPSTDIDQAEQRATDLQQALAAAPLMHNDTLRILTMSVGVSMLHADDSIESLLHRADQAVYAAKRAGRNRVVREHEPSPTAVGMRP